MVKLTASARCLHRDCGWAAAGSPDEADRAAEKHWRGGHPVVTVTEAVQ